MHFSIEKKHFKSLVKPAIAATEKRASIPILGYILLSANEDELKASGTDMDIYISTKRESQTIEENGEVCIPASILSDILEKMPDGIVTCIKNDEKHTLQITGQGGKPRFVLKTMDPENYPEFDSGSPTHTFTIDKLIIDSIVGKTAYAVSKEETRYYLNGIYLHHNEGELIAAATDGHRLAQKKNIMPELTKGHAEDMPSIIIPIKTVKAIKDLHAADGYMAIGISKEKIKVTTENQELTSRLIDGTYPDYERVIPTDNDITIPVNKTQLENAIACAAILSSASNGIKLHFTDNKLFVTSSSIEGHIAEDNVLLAEQCASSIEIGTNNKYLSKAINTFNGEEILFQMSDSNSPIIITSETEEDIGYLSVLMPMRV